MESEPIILVLFGITGDLAQRKLLPALAEIQNHGSLPDKLKIIGITRQEVNIDDLLAGSLGGSSASASATLALRRKVEILRMDPARKDDFSLLEKRIRTLEKQQGTSQLIYYVSVPPQISMPIIRNLGSTRLSRRKTSKLLLEKPFGTDLASALELVEQLRAYFAEEQIYRIDHFLAKEMAQNILFFREGNALFQHVWHSQAIESIDIIASEKIDIEGRAIFYEQTGALRDVLQSHLMQLLALILADIPTSSIQEARLKALQQLDPADPSLAVRGQYIGYGKEVGNPGSLTETFTAVTLRSHDPVWKGVPLRLLTGKALDRKSTEINIHFRATKGSKPNTLTLRIQPKEGVEIDLWTKQPGYERKSQLAELNFNYALSGSRLPDAYEQVILDVLRSDKTLFASSDEIIAAWKVLQPLQQNWSMQTTGLIHYPKGSDPTDITTAKN
jgi:glucose-6-phosphate 1-dehydrogenase